MILSKGNQQGYKTRMGTNLIDLFPFHSLAAVATKQCHATVIGRLFLMYLAVHKSRICIQGLRQAVFPDAITLNHRDKSGSYDPFLADVKNAVLPVKAGALLLFWVPVFQRNPRTGSFC